MWMCQHNICVCVCVCVRALLRGTSCVCGCLSLYRVAYVCVHTQSSTTSSRPSPHGLRVWSVSRADVHAASPCGRYVVFFVWFLTRILGVIHIHSTTYFSTHMDHHNIQGRCDVNNESIPVHIWAHSRVHAHVTAVETSVSPSVYVCIHDHLIMLTGTHPTAVHVHISVMHMRANYIIPARIRQYAYMRIHPDVRMHMRM